MFHSSFRRCYIKLKTNEGLNCALFLKYNEDFSNAKNWGQFSQYW